MINRKEEIKKNIDAAKENKISQLVIKNINDYMPNFDETIKILPYADKIKKLNGVCVDCGSELGNYSFADFDKKEEIVVGDSKYKCLCSECYQKNMQKKSLT